jgi:ferredoxin-NADP reductase
MLADSTEAGDAVPTAEGATAGNERFAVRVNAIREEADGIRSFEFVSPDGSDLPPFTAGAHLHVHLDDKISRQYSLCNDPAERHRYVVAVLREENGRGGSKLMHDSISEGQEVWISGPENHFALADRAVNFHLLLAGGIGVTPMMAMIEELERRGHDYRMHYCTRGPERTAFLDRLAPRIEAGKVVLHHDGGDPARGLDVKATLAEHRIGMHLYACGPAGFLQAVNSSVGAWPPHTVHQEYFTAREMTEEEKAWDTKPFQVKIASTGAVIDIPAGRSIVDVLRDYGINVQTDCQEGYCGTCITHYVEGDPVHRDTVLDDTDREDYVMICCARARSDLLVLDL